MEFREARMGDAANLAALTLQVWLHTYAKQGIRSALSNYVLSELTADKVRTSVADDRQTIILCEVEAHLVGYVRLDFSSPCPSDAGIHSEISTLYVQAHFLRRGIGTQLLLRAFEALRRRGRDSVWLSVNCENDDALRFYDRHAFRTRGSLHFALDGERHENVILYRTVGEARDRPLPGAVPGT